MKAGVLGFYILLITLIFSVLSLVVQATEYREVNKDVQAADILNHIEKGDDVNLTKCHIFGELDLSKVNLVTVPNPDFRTYLIEYGVRENLSIVKSNISI